MDDNSELAHPPEASGEFAEGAGVSLPDGAPLVRGAPVHRGANSRVRYLRVLGLLFLAGTLVTAGLYGWRWWELRQLFIVTDNAQVKAPLLQISSKIAGRLEEVTVVEGDRVQPGQVIARLDRTALADQVRAAEAALGQARNRLAQAQAGVVVSREDVGLQVQQARQAVDAAAGRVEAARMALVAQESQVAQQVAQARAALAAAEAEVERYESAAGKARRDLVRHTHLHKDGAVAARDVDDARTELETAQARVRAARAQIAERQAALDLALRGRETVEVRRAELMQAQALHRHAMAALETTQAGIRRVQVQNLEVPILREQVAQSEAALRVAREALDSTVITARQAGVVVQRGAHPGEYVQPGRPIVVMADLAGTYVGANLNETDVRRIRPGQRVTITADAYPGRTFRGHVIGIVPAAEAELALIPTRTNAGSFTKIVQWIPVRIAIDGANDVLAPGMSVTVRVEVGRGSPTPSR